MIKIDKNLIHPLLKAGAESPRRRKNFNFHPEASDPIHRMLHASNPDTYVQPHKHENPDKMEAFLVLKGKFLLIEFDDEGKILDHIILEAGTENYGVELPPRTWHTVITLENDSVFYEVKTGPWNPSDDKNFAPWAPSEGDEGCAEYNENILKQLQLL